MNIDSFNTFFIGIQNKLLNFRIKIKSNTKPTTWLWVHYNNKTISEHIKLLIVCVFWCSRFKMNTLLFSPLLFFSLSFICVYTGFVISNSPNKNNNPVQLGEIWIESPTDKINTCTQKCVCFVCMCVKERIIKNNVHELIGIRNFFMAWWKKKSWEFSLCKCNVITFQLQIISMLAHWMCRISWITKIKKQPVIFPLVYAFALNCFFVIISTWCNDSNLRRILVCCFFFYFGQQFFSFSVMSHWNMMTTFGQCILCKFFTMSHD